MYSSKFLSKILISSIYCYEPDSNSHNLFTWKHRKHNVFSFLQRDHNIYAVRSFFLQSKTQMSVIITFEQSSIDAK